MKERLESIEAHLQNIDHALQLYISDPVSLQDVVGRQIEDIKSEIDALKRESRESTN